MNEHFSSNDPTPRELQGQIDALKTLMDERGKRYEEAFVASSRAVDAALAAAKEAVKAAFDSAEKAIAKAEMSQTVYNQTHNDLQRRMTEEGREFSKKDDLEREAKRTEERFEDFRRVFYEYQQRQAAELKALTAYQSHMEGKGQGMGSAWSIGLAVVGLIGLLVSMFLGISGRIAP